MSRFCKGDIKKFVLMLWKVYSFNETWWPEKEEFHCNLNIDHITDTDYKYARKVGKDFGMKNQGEYHDLHVQTNTLLWADVFETSRNKCIEIYKVDPICFLLGPRLVGHVVFKKAKVELELFTDGWKRDQRWIM